MRSSLLDFLTIRTKTVYRNVLNLIYSFSNISFIYSFTTIAYFYNIVTKIRTKLHHCAKRAADPTKTEDLLLTHYISVTITTFET